MDDRLVGRRSVLRGVGVAAGAAVAATAVAGVAGASAPPTGDSNALIGCWMTERQDEVTTEPSRGLFSFAAGGVAWYQDIAPADPTIASGPWAAAADGTFRSTIWTGVAANEQTGAPAYTAFADSVITVDGDMMSATYVTRAFDATTNGDLATLHGTMTGTRIVA